MKHILKSVAGCFPSSKLANVIKFLELLDQNRKYSRQFSLSVWEFPFYLRDLSLHGVSENELRALFYSGIVRIADCSTGNESKLVELDSLPLHEIPNNFLVALSDFELHSAGSVDNHSHNSPVVAKPKWDIHVRELSFCGNLVKKFKWSAVNQEAVLAAFEEEGWPPWIYDPLKPSTDFDTRRRLHDTIRCLNQRHRLQLLSFHGDGTGEGVSWQSSKKENGSLA